MLVPYSVSDKKILRLLIRGLKIIREGCDYYLIHQGEIQRCLGSVKPIKDCKEDVLPLFQEEKEQQPAEAAESILFFIGDLEAACAKAKRVCL